MTSFEPAVLHAETMKLRLSEIALFEKLRAAAGQPPPPQWKFPSWLSNAMAKASSNTTCFNLLVRNA